MDEPVIATATACCLLAPLEVFGYWSRWMMARIHAAVMRRLRLEHHYDEHVVPEQLRFGIIRTYLSGLTAEQQWKMLDEDLAYRRWCNGWGHWPERPLWRVACI